MLADVLDERVGAVLDLVTKGRIGAERLDHAVGARRHERAIRHRRADQIAEERRRHMRGHVDCKVEFIALDAIEQVFDDLTRDLSSPLDRGRTEQRREQAPLPAMLFAFERCGVPCKVVISRALDGEPAHCEQFLEADREPFVAQKFPRQVVAEAFEAARTARHRLAFAKFGYRPEWILGVFGRKDVEERRRFVGRTRQGCHGCPQHSRRHRRNW